MEPKNPGRRQSNRDYTLSFDEFVEIIGAIREIPRIYSSIEKMESNIQRLTQDQGKRIEDLGGRIENAVYRISQLEEAAKKSPYIQLGSQDKNGGITQKDLLNLIIKGITLIGAFGSIIYALIQGASGGH